MIRLVIYDDSEHRRKSLQALMLLNPELECVGSFPDCRNVLAEMESLKPDIVLMDIEMPNVNGIQGVAIIKAGFPQIRVIMQTVFEDEDRIFAALQAGADGYLLKNSDTDKILQSIEDVYNGGAYLTPSVALRVMRHFNQPAMSSQSNLSARETEVLNLLANGNSHKMVANQLNITYHTVGSHVKKIYEKLQVHSVTEAVAKAKNQKLV